MTECDEIRKGSRGGGVHRFHRQTRRAVARRGWVGWFGRVLALGAMGWGSIYVTAMAPAAATPSPGDTPAAAASPQEPAVHLPQATGWWAHLDVDRLRGSSLAPLLRQRLETDEPLNGSLKRLERVTGVALRDRLHALTLWGTAVEATGVWAELSDATRALDARLRAVEGYQEHRVGAPRVQSFLLRDRASAQRRVYVRQQVSTETSGRLQVQAGWNLAALDEARMPGAPVVLAPEMLAAVQLQDMAAFRAAVPGRHSVLLTHVQQLDLTVRESAAGLAWTLDARTETAAQAEQLQHLLVGLLALARLESAEAADQNPWIVWLATHADVQRTAGGVRLTLETDVASLGARLVPPPQQP